MTLLVVIISGVAIFSAWGPNFERFYDGLIMGGPYTPPDITFVNFL